jgi:hypothetical protein
MKKVNKFKDVPQIMTLKKEISVEMLMNFLRHGKAAFLRG